MSTILRRAVIFSGVALLVAGCNRHQEKTSSRSSTATKAPELVATTPDGQVVQLENLRGRVVLVNFWSAGCGPCMAEMPEIDAFYRAHRDQGFAVLAIGVDTSAAAVAREGKMMNVSFPLLIDPLGITKDRYGVNATPTSVVIDARGNVVDRVLGALDRRDLDGKISPLL